MALARARSDALERQLRLDRRLFVVDAEAQLRVCGAAGSAEFFAILDWAAAMKR